MSNYATMTFKMAFLMTTLKIRVAILKTNAILEKARRFEKASERQSFWGILV
jgi:hypothetical protein